MEEILSELDSIAEQIEGLENKRKKLGNFLNEIKEVEIKDDEILEDRLSIPVEPGDLEGKKIGGVDGGLVKRAYHAVDLVLTKAVAAIFDYGGKLDVSYVPGALPTPKLSVFTEPYSRGDFSLAANLERMETEINLVFNLIQKRDLDLLLLDGSIVPHPSSRPPKDSDLRSRYDSIVEKYGNVFRKSHCLLGGVSEDSRARRLSKIISRKILKKVDSERKGELKEILEGTKDTNLLFHVLNQGERSFCFTCFDGNNSSPFPEEIKEKIYSFYLKTTRYDRPLRVDFFSEEDPVETADRIASLLLPTSSQNEEYGIPVMLIEADYRARLTEEELDFVYSSLQDKVGDVPSLYELRREKRPF